MAAAKRPATSTVSLSGPLIVELDRLAKAAGVDRETMIERLVTGDGTPPRPRLRLTGG